jgi:hypothetical protein
MDDHRLPEVSTTNWRKGTWLTAHRKRDFAQTPTPKEQQRTEEGEKGWTHFAAGKTADANRAKGKRSGWPETPPRNHRRQKVLEEKAAHRKQGREDQLTSSGGRRNTTPDAPTR